jgi:hypothetical protein
MTHFPRQRCSTILVTGNAPAPKSRAWAELTGALGLPEATVGERTATTAPRAPRFAGNVERTVESKHHHELMLRLDEPSQGVVFVFAFEYLERVYATLHAYLFGDEGSAVAAREEPRWQAWMDRRFPSAEAISGTGARTS